MTRVIRWATPALALLLSSGCALTSKNDPIEPRYFSPEQALDLTRRARAKPLGIALRLRRVRGAAHLQERIVYRVGAHERGFHEDRRWTEEPAEFLRRALAYVLFEERGFRRALGGDVPTLEVELSAFDELRRPKPGVRVKLSYVLHDGDQALAERTVVVSGEVKGDEERRPQAVAEALGRALREAVDQVAERLVARLKKR